MSQRSSLEQAELLWLLEQCLRFSSPQIQEELSSPETTVQSKHTPLTVDTNEKEIDTPSSGDPEVKRTMPQRTNTAQVSVEGDEPKINFDSGSQDNLSIQSDQTLPPLFDDLEMARTLRQILQSSQTNNKRYLNISETVSTSASIDDLLPVFAPESHSDSTLIIIQERTDSLAPFDELQDSIKRVAETYVHFYRVLIPNLTKESIAKATIDIPNPKHCVVLFISDGLSPLVQRGQLIDYLEPLPSGCKVVWIHPWRVEARPPYVRRMPPSRPEELPSKRDRKQISIQIVGLQNIQFQRIIHFVNGRSLTWNDGKLLRIPTKRRRRESRKLSSDEALSKELTNEEQELAALQLHAHVEAYSGKQTLQLLGVVACLPAGCIDTNMLVQLAQSVFDVQYDQTDLAQLLSAGVLAKHVGLSTDSVLVVGFNDRILRQTFRDSLAKSTIPVVIRELLKLARTTKENHKHFETMGLNINLLLQLKEGTVSTEGLRKASHSGDLSDYIELAELNQWYVGLSQLKQFEQSLNAQDSSVLERDQTIQLPPRSSKPDEPNKNILALSNPFIEFGITGFLVQLLSDIFTNGIPCSIIEHLSLQISESRESIDLINFFDETPLFTKTEATILEESSLVFPLPKDAENNADWGVVPDALRASNIHESVFKSDDYTDFYFFAWCHEEYTTEIARQGISILTEWINHHWRSIPHTPILISRLYVLSQYLHIPCIFNLEEQSDENASSAVEFLDNICELSIWDVFSHPKYVNGAEHSFAQNHLLSEGNTNLSPGKTEYQSRVDTGEFYKMLCWWGILDDIESDSIPPNSRLQQIIDHKRENDESASELTKDTSFIEFFGIEQFLYNWDWSTYDKTLLQQLEVRLQDTELGPRSDPFEYFLNPWNTFRALVDLLMCVSDVNHVPQLDLITHTGSEDDGIDPAPLQVRKQFARVIKYHTFLAKIKEEDPSPLLRKYIQEALAVGGSSMGLHEDTLFELFNAEFMGTAVTTTPSSGLLSLLKDKAGTSDARQEQLLDKQIEEVIQDKNAFTVHHHFLSPFPIIQMQYEMADSSAQDHSVEQWLEWYLSQDFEHFENFENLSVCKEDSCGRYVYAPDGDALCWECSREIINNTKEYLGKPWAAFKRFYLPKEPLETIERKKDSVKLYFSRHIANVFLSLWSSLQNIDHLPMAQADYRLYDRVYDLFDSSLTHADEEIKSLIDDLTLFIENFEQSPWDLLPREYTNINWHSLDRKINDPFLGIERNPNFDVNNYENSDNPNVSIARAILIRQQTYSRQSCLLSKILHQLTPLRDREHILKKYRIGKSDSIFSDHNSSRYSSMDESDPYFSQWNYPLYSLLRWFPTSNEIEFNTYCCHTMDIPAEYHHLDLRSANLEHYLEMRPYDPSSEDGTPIAYRVGSDEPLTLPVQSEWIDPIAEFMDSLLTDPNHPHRTTAPPLSPQCTFKDLETLDQKHKFLLSRYCWTLQTHIETPIEDTFRSEWPSPVLYSIWTNLLSLVLANDRTPTEDDGSNSSPLQRRTSALLSTIKKVWYRIKHKRNQTVNDMGDPFWHKPIMEYYMRLSWLYGATNPINDSSYFQNVIGSNRLNISVLTAYWLSCEAPNGPLLQQLIKEFNLSEFTDEVRPFQQLVALFIRANNLNSNFIHSIVNTVTPEIIEQWIEQISEKIKVSNLTDLMSLEQALISVQFFNVLLQFRNPDLHSATTKESYIHLLSVQNPIVQQILLSTFQLYKTLDSFTDALQQKYDYCIGLNQQVHTQHENFLELQQQLQQERLSGMRSLQKYENDNHLQMIEDRFQEIERAIHQEQHHFPYLSGYIHHTSISTHPKSLHDIASELLRATDYIVGQEDRQENSHPLAHEQLGFNKLFSELSTRYPPKHMTHLEVRDYLHKCLNEHLDPNNKLEAYSRRNNSWHGLRKEKTSLGIIFGVYPGPKLNLHMGTVVKETHQDWIDRLQHVGLTAETDTSGKNWLLVPVSDSDLFANDKLTVILDCLLTRYRKVNA